MDNLKIISLFILSLALIFFGVSYSTATYTNFPECASGQYITITTSGPTCSAPSAGGVAAGIIAFYNGTCPAAWTEVTAARGFAIVGTPSGGTDSGTVGTALTNLQDKSITPTFSGAALATHSHDTGTYATSAHSGTAVADHASHTHSVTSNVTVNDHASHTHTYTDVVNHTHTLATGTGSTGNFSQVIGTVDTSSGGTGGSPTQTALGTLSGNPGGGVATGTTAGPSATLTHTANNPAVTSAGPSATLTHAVTQPSAHTLSGSSSSVGAGTPSGTVSSIATSSILAYIQLRVCSKN